MSPATTALLDHPVVVCLGTGGVGKTTVASALAMAAAAEGRRSLVVTVDPARRLAGALGVELGDDPTVVDGPWPGEMSALMLDRRRALDRVVARHAPDRETAEAVMTNRYYRNLLDVAPGAAEHAVTEVLHELHTGGEWDLVVVDTPPARDALTILAAPRLMLELAGRSMLGGDGAVSRVRRVAMNAALRTVGRIIGRQVLEEVRVFFNALSDMRDGLEERARAVDALLAGPDVAYACVTRPRHDTLVEVRTIRDQLATEDRYVHTVFVNLMRPDPPARGPADLRALATGADPATAAALESLASLKETAAMERALVEDLVADIEPTAVVRLRMLDGDVGDVAGVAAVSAMLRDAQL